jgi:hypothetical protein
MIMKPHAFKTIALVAGLILLSSFKLDNFYDILRPVDDTASLQASITAGDYNMPANHTYHISGNINITHNLKGSGNDTVYYTWPSGKAFTMNTAGKKVSNFVLIGPNDATSTTGANGIFVIADNCTVDLMKIRRWNGNGVLATSGNNLVVTRSTIADCAYTCIFAVPNASLIGGTISLDTLDKSMYSPSFISQAALQIKKDALNAYGGWTVNNNLIKMPVNPTDPGNSEECMEIRNFPRSNIFNNTMVNGTIGISVVAGDYTKVNGNYCTGQKLEAIEFANSNHCYSNANKLRKSVMFGYLLDGYGGTGALGCHYDTLATLDIDSCTNHAVQIYTNDDNILLTSGTIKTKSVAVYMQKSSKVTICSVTMIGTGGGANPVVLDTSPGYLTICGGSATGFSGSLMKVYNHNVGTTDYLYTVGISPHVITTDLVTGTLGTHQSLN